MKKDIFTNYEAFYTMVISTTMLSNSCSKEWKKDSIEIIEFIGKAYNLTEDLINECKSIIIDDLSLVGLSTDRKLINNNRNNEEEFSEDDILIDIKNNCITDIQEIDDDKYGKPNKHWFDYEYFHIYQANIRFSEIQASSSTGNILATRTLSLMNIIGIGCPKNIAKGIQGLKQCVMWGDIVSMHLISYAYKSIKDNSNTKVYADLSKLSSEYLNYGVTTLPEDLDESIDILARKLYVMISTIKQDIILAFNIKNIDFSFVEAILDESIDEYAKMGYINNYERKEWKEVTNSSKKPVKNISFR